MTQTMRVSQVVIGQNGRFHLEVASRAVPVPGVGEVLIHVHAAGVNGHDVHHVHRGSHPIDVGETDLPGLEIAGIVVSTAERSAPMKPGDAVCALIRGGGYAEYAIASVDLCLPVPHGLSLLEAATLPEAFFTIWSNVMIDARLAAGESFLMNGGSSGIGVTAIQLFAALGHPVYATARGPEKASRCVELGARRAIDYEAEDFATALMKETNGLGVNVILDIVGGEYLNRDLAAIARGGRIVFIGAARGYHTEIDIRELMNRQAAILGSLLRPRPLAYKATVARQLLAQVWPLISDGKIKPVLDRSFTLESANAAIEFLDQRRQFGKIVLQIEESGSGVLEPRDVAITQ